MNTVLGIDIGSAFIKIVESRRDKKNSYITNAAIAPVSGKGLLSEASMDHEQIARQVKSLLRDTGIKTRQANISIAESQVFTRVIETPRLSDKELTQALKWEAEQYIPMPLEDVNMDFIPLTANETNDQMQILLIAAPTSLVKKYTAMLGEMTGLEVFALESEGIGLLRVFGEKEKSRLIVNFAASTTNVYILKRDTLVLAHTISTGGNVLTRALSSELNLPLAQAEEYKRTYGLDKKRADGKVAQILGSFVDGFITEITQSLTFFKEKYPEDVISQVLITGGGALMPQLTIYLNEKLQMEVAIGNPWQGFAVDKKVSDQIKGEETVFSVATGLSLREPE